MSAMPLRIPAPSAWPRKSSRPGSPGSSWTTPGRSSPMHLPRGGHERAIAKELRKLGFKDVRILKGGLGAWTNAGLPIESRSDISEVGLELYKALAGVTR